MFETQPWAGEKSAEEIAAYLRGGSTVESAKVIIGHRLTKAIFDNNIDDMFLWMIIFARFQGQPLSIAIRKELTFLLGAEQLN